MTVLIRSARGRMLNIDGIKYCIRLEITETPTEEFYFQWGVFLSRSSKKFVTLGLVMMLIFPWLQVCVKVNSPDITLNFQVLMAIGFVVNTMFVFIPHFAIASFLVLLEGIIGGIAYVNVYSYVHRTVSRPQFVDCRSTERELKVDK